MKDTVSVVCTSTSSLASLDSNKMANSVPQVTLHPGTWNTFFLFFPFVSLI